MRNPLKCHDFLVTAVENYAQIFQHRFTTLLLSIKQFPTQCNGLVIAILAIALCACQTEHFTLIRPPTSQDTTLPSTKSADPATIQMPYHAQWQTRCNTGLWPAFLLADLPAVSAGFMAGMKVDVADPTLGTFLRQLTRSLCAPLQPYRATLRYAIQDNKVEYVIETLSAQQYSVQQAENSTCIRNNGKAYQKVDERWQEFINLDTPACGHPLQLLILPFLPTTLESGPIMGHLLADPQAVLDGRLTNVYTITSELAPLAGQTAGETVNIQVWLDAHSGVLVQIEFLAVGAFHHFQIDFQHDIRLSVAIPPDESR